MKHKSVIPKQKRSGWPQYGQPLGSKSAADDLIRSTACFGKDENLTPGGKIESRTPEGKDENLTQKRPRKPHCKLENEFEFAKKDKF